MALTVDQPQSAVPSGTAAGRAVELRTVLALGLVAEAVIAAGLLWPLGIWRAPDTITSSEPLSEMLGQSGSGLVRFLSVLVVWAAVYLAAVAVSRRAPASAARGALLLLPVVFAITLAPTWPAASKDVYHYVLEGRIIVAHGASPLTTAPNAFPDDPLFWILSSWESEPSRYGPLWAALTALPARLGGENLRAIVLAFKAVGVLSFAGTGVFVYFAARRLAPSLALPAYVLIAWNPLFIFESAANAHNDSLMLLFTAAALYCAVRRDWTLAFPALTAAVLIKFTTGLLGPLLLVWAWRTARDRAERRRIALGLGLAALLAVAAYLPFWEGLATFRAITSASANALNSPGWLLREALERSIATEDAARRVVSSLLALVFGAGYLAALRLVWNGRAGEDWPWLGGFIAIAAYLLTVSWWFWPWYITWLLPLTALLAFRPAAIVGVVWSVAALAAYVPITFRPYFWGEPPDDRMPFAVALTTFIPALLVITALLSSQARRRISLLYEERDPSRRSG